MLFHHPAPSKVCRLIVLICGLVLVTLAARAATIANPPFVRLALGNSHTIALQVNASGVNMAYQWYRGASGDTSQPVIGATNDLLVSPPPAAPTLFWVRVTDASGSIDSEAFQVNLPLTTPGTIFSVGANFIGQAGDGTTTSRSTWFQGSDEVISIAGGGGHTLFLKTDGSLWATGYNGKGQLGDSSVLNRSAPVQVATGVACIAAGDSHSLFVKTDGNLWAMGDNLFGQLGIGTSDSNAHPVPVLITNSVVSVSAGAHHSLFVKTDGSFWAMGSNLWGQLGNGTNVSTASPIQVGDTVVSAAAGRDHSLFIKAGGSLWSMGLNTSGQLGIGVIDPSERVRSTPTQIATGVASVSASDHSVFLKTDGSLWTMGKNYNGQLGDGAFAYRSYPLQIATDVTAASAGGSHTLFLKSDRSLWAAGDNFYGQLGDGATTASPVPRQVSTGVLALSAGASHSLAIRTPYTVTFDLGAHGNRVGGGVEIQPVFGETAAIPPVVSAVAGWGFVGWDVSFAHITADLTVTAIYEAVIAPQISSQPVSPGSTPGSSGLLALKIEATGSYLEYQWYQGASGDISQPVAGATGPLLVRPRLTTTASFWVRVTNSVGSADSEAVEIQGVAVPSASLFASGQNSDGQLGDGSASNQLSPIWIEDGVVSAFANGSQSLFIKSDGSLWAAGNNSSGQLGDGTTVDHAVPVQVASEVASVATGSSHTFVLKTDGSLWGSGGNYHGELGIGAGPSQAVPVSVATGVALACAGTSHSLFLKVDGSLWSVGRNTYGQLGDGSTTDRDVPAKIAGDVVFAAAGNSQTFFIKTDGSLWAAGLNDSGQLGAGSLNSNGIATPVQIATGVTAVAASNRHSLFIKTDGSLWAMGDNSHGQLGRYDIPGYSPTPIQVAPERVIHAAASGNHSFFLKSDGTLWAMGLNYYGELGYGPALVTRRVPLQVASEVLAISTGSEHSLIVGASRNVTFDLGAHGTRDGGGSLTQRVLRRAGAVPPSVTAEAGWGFAGWAADFSSIDADTTIAARYEAAIHPAITSQPVLLRANMDTTPALRVAVSGNFLKYQWYRGLSGDTSQPVVGADRAVLVPTPFFTPTRFWVRASNSAGATDSQALLVEPPVTAPTRPAALFASGDNTYGQFGDGTTTTRYNPVSVNTDCVSASAGANHSLFIKPDGSLWAMGRNHKGQLGDGSTLLRNSPVKIADGVRAASAGNEHSVFIKTDGSLWGMGSTASGQLGTGAYTSTLKTTPILIANDVATVLTGADFTLLVKLDGTLWGTGASFATPSPVQLADGVASISASGEHQLYVKTNGSLWAKGSNSQGQLGGGLPFGIGLSGFVPVADEVLSIAAGATHSLLLKFDGTLLATGYNNYGQLGNGTTTRANTPILIASDVTAIAAGSQHSLFRKADGSLWGMGNNSGWGGAGSPRWLSPILVFPRVTTFAAGGANCLIARATQRVTFDLGTRGTRTGGGALSQWVITGDSAVAPTVIGTPAWGFAGWNMPLDNITADAGIIALYDAVVAPVLAGPPARLNAGTGASALLRINASGYYLTYQWYEGASGDVSRPVAGASGKSLVLPTPRAHTSYWVRVANNAGFANSQALVVAAASPADFFATGSNSLGQLGDGSGVSRSSPGKIGSDTIAVSSGDTHSLILKADGSLWAVGGNASGQLGDGSTTHRTIPVQVGADVASISAGGSHSLFLKADGSLWAMGLNTYGQLGDGSTTRRTSPVLVTGNVASIAAGLNNHSLFIKRDGTLWGMGSNLFGKLGLGASDNQAHSVPVQIATDVTAAAAGDSHSLFLKGDDSLWGTGSSVSGQLAIPAPNTASYIPVQISSGVRAFAAGGNHTLFVKTSGSLWALGRNSSGQLGLGSTDSNSHPSPAQVATGVATVHAGEAHGFFLKADGSLWAMGRNTSGELGDGSIINRSAPVQIATNGGITSVSAGDIHSLFAFLPTDATFASWSAAAGLSGADAAPEADPDGDGVPNLLEYAYGTMPRQSTGPDLLPAVALETVNSERHLSFTHRRRKTSGLTYAYRTAGDLAASTVWTPVNVTPTVIDSDADGDGLVEVVVVSIPLGVAPRLFFKLTVQE